MKGSSSALLHHQARKNLGELHISVTTDLCHYRSLSLQSLLLQYLCHYRSLSLQISVTTDLCHYRSLSLQISVTAVSVAAVSLLLQYLCRCSISVLQSLCHYSLSVTTVSLSLQYLCCYGISVTTVSGSRVCNMLGLLSDICADRAVK